MTLLNLPPMNWGFGGGLHHYFSLNLADVAALAAGVGHLGQTQSIEEKEMLRKDHSLEHSG